MKRDLVLATGIIVLLACSAASAQTAAIRTPDDRGRALAEQAMPRTAVALDPAQFDKFTGAYEVAPTAILHVMRSGDHFFIQMTRQPQVEVFPESANKFFTRAIPIPAQVSFNTDAAGAVTGAVLHQGGNEIPAPRIDEVQAKAMETALTQRVAANTASSGTEAALRHQIAAMEDGAADYAAMTPPLASAAQQQSPIVESQIKEWGALKSLSFKGVGQGGWDIYDAAFEHQTTEWRIAPLTSDGKIPGMTFRPAG